MRIAIAGTLALAAFAGSGCERQRFQIEPPPFSTTARSAVVRVTAGTDEVVHAFSLEDDRGLALDLDRLEELGSFKLTVLEYEPNLDDLAWQEGLILAAAGAIPCNRQAPARVWTAEVEETTVADWENETLPASMLKYIQTDPECLLSNLCSSFETPEVVTLDSTDFVRAIEVQADGTFLMGTGDKRFFELQTDGTFTRRPDLEHIEPITSTKDALGNIWIGGHNGQLWRISADGQLETESLGTQLTVAGIGVSPSGSSKLAITTNYFSGPSSPSFTLQFFLQKPDADWKLVHTSSVALFEVNGLDIAWATDEIAYASYGGGDMFQLVDEMVELDPTLPAVEAIDEHSELTLLASTRVGDVLRWTPSGWLTVPNATLGIYPKAFVELERGFMVGNNNAVVRQVVPGALPCAPFGAASSEIQRMRKSGKVVALTGTNAPGMPPPVTLLRIGTGAGVPQ